MATIIKNQILKHLSKFAKNLTVDQINVEVLRGRGAMENIELNEDVLTDVLELPAWLRIQKATCNRIAVKIPWTSLKTSPVQLFIDEIRVEMVLSSEFLHNRPNSASSSTPFSGEHSNLAGYGFANRVVEGMSLYINTVEVFFTSEKFGGSFMLSRLCVESRTPTWKETSDLHQTRIRDQRLQQVLLFKQVSWQLFRIEASSLPASDETSPSGAYNINAPLRLLTNQGSCRITMKKSTVDGGVVTGRLQLILGDILWVATLPQVRSAIHFYLYLMEMIQKAAELNKVQKAGKLLKQADLIDISLKGATSGAKLAPPPQSRGNPGTINAAFVQFDVTETSYHFYGARIDLHICDEPTEAQSSPSAAMENALQLTMQKLSIDFYPYHLAAGERSSWIYYKDRACREWMVSSLNSYYKLFSSKLDSRTRERLRNEWPKLMAQCCIVRLDDIVVHCLTKAGDRGPVEKLLSCEREVLKLPDDMPVLHAEFADYYYASEQCNGLPLPPSNTHAQWNPIRIFLDYKTLRWLSYLYLDICSTLGLKSSSFETVPHHDVHVEALMPRLVIPVEDNTSAAVSSPCRKPTSLIVQTANIVLENTSIIGNVGRDQAALKNCLSQLEDFPLFNIPNDAVFVGGIDLTPLPTQTESFRRYLTTMCESEQSKMPLGETSRVGVDQADESGSSVAGAATDIWTVSLSPVWIDFNGVDPVHYPRPLPFLSDVPVSIWLIPNLVPTDGSNSSTAASLTALLRVDGPVKVSMDCHQFAFLYQVMDDLSSLLQAFVDDAKRLADRIRARNDGEESTAATLSVCVSCLLPLIDLSFLLPVGNDTSDGNSERANSQNSSDLSATGYQTNIAAVAGQNQSPQSSEAISVRPKPDIQPIGAFRTDTPNIFLQGGFTPDIDAASIDIAIGSVVVDDAASVITDASDLEDDNFIQVESPEGSPFDDIFQSQYTQRSSVSSHRGGHRTMEAMEAYEEEKERLCGHKRTTALIDMTTRLLQRKVSVVTLHLRQCQTVFAYAGEESRLTLLAPLIDSEENHDITLEEAHRLLNTKAPVSPSQPTRSVGNFPVELRLGFRDEADPGYLEMEVRKLEMALRNENLMHLSAFLEAIPPPPEGKTSMYMRVNLTDSTVVLRDPDTTELPTQLRLDQLRVVKTNGNDTDMEPKVDMDENRKMAQLERENAELRKKLAEAKALIQRLAKDNMNLAL